MGRKREVVYVLSAQTKHGRVVPISTHARYVEALRDSKPWHGKRGVHRVIRRYSIPAY